MEEVLIGIDVGSGGARSVAVTRDGTILSLSSVPFDRQEIQGLPSGWWEQDPEMWWQATLRAVREALAGAPNGLPGPVVCIGVCSTSGSLVLLDEHRQPARPAIMYSDTRSEEQAVAANDVAGRVSAKTGVRFGSSFALPKILWVMENEREVFDRSCLVAHPADFILGRLTGVWGVTDFNNALKTGYNLIENRWPAYLATRMGVPRQMLPRVAAPGEFLGYLGQDLAKEWGIENPVKVVTGTTDGVAGLFASGASSPGDWSSTLGTTLVVKGITVERLKDPDGRFYNHLHPKGWWLPGGASNVGGECLKVKFPDDDWKMLDEQVERWMPTSLVIYPLMREGERLPFKNPEAVGFMAGKASCAGQLFTGYLEGVALVERWIYDVLGELDCPSGDSVFVSGGGSKSLPWLRIRASALNRRLLRASCVEPCLGAAILAASATVYSDLAEATKAMVKIDRVVEPDPDLTKEYAKRYSKLRKACDAIGYG